MKNVDIVVGGQFGDEGKGQICAWLTHEQMNENKPYTFAVRVGGSNAEHRFYTPDGKYHIGRVLPVAGWVDPAIKLILGAGHMIKLDSLFREIAILESMYGNQDDRIFIDSQAGVIEPRHIEMGKETAWRGSTHQGTGQAVAHKVLRDGQFRVARDCPELDRYIHVDTVGLMNDWARCGRIGLLEGSQGVMLSLNHGYYPFCTSKDVTPAALLAEAGIATNHVRHIWGVYRTIPMRVPGNSGPCGSRELSWEELELAIGKSIPEDAKKQTDSGDRERVFLWSWKDFLKSIILINPTHIALTFTDWWAASLTSSTTIGLTMDGFIETIERLARCPVNIVRNGVAWNDYHLRKKGGQR